MKTQIRFVNTANSSDSQAILNIYKPFIISSDITFECTVPTIEEFSERIKNTTKQFPYLVFEIDGVIAGYAYATKQREREAFQWNTEISVYVSTKYQRQGIAQKLYTILLEILTAQGYKTAYGCITYPNDKSISLHEKFGFSQTAIFYNTGFKLGKWLNVIWLEKALGEFENEPTPPVPISKLDEKLLATILENNS